MEIQVQPSHYEFEKYVDINRLNSYYYQLKLIYEASPESVLEVGIGNNFIKNFLPSSIQYNCIDIERNLAPSVVGNITQLPYKSCSFDIVACFQVLEHLPFGKAIAGFKELNRVSKKNVLLSLPFANHKFGIEFFLPFFHNFEIKYLMPRFYKKHPFCDQHYWEIGMQGYSLKKVKQILCREMNLIKSFSPKENSNKIFFVFEKYIPYE